MREAISRAPLVGRNRMHLVGGWTAAAPVVLSIVMPVHNEEGTLYHAIEAILHSDIPCEFELLIVNDGSTDRSHLMVDSFDDKRITYIHKPLNQGKGAAVLTAIAAARGTHMLVFDADLEYDAADIASVVNPVIQGRASIVYGARVNGMRTVFPSLKYALGNGLTTLAANLVFGSYLTDMHTCLKLIPLDLLRTMRLAESGFGLDTEITGELLRRGYRPFEVPVTYSARSHLEGKKITAADGVRCLYVLAKVRLRGRVAPPPQHMSNTVSIGANIESMRHATTEAAELAG